MADNNSIEVTSEMVEAGFKVLSGSGIADEYMDADKLLVAEIFLAMWAQHQRETTDTRTCPPVAQ